MRLLNTRTGEFKVVYNPKEVRFAILSHVWDKEGEQTHADLVKIQENVHAERDLNPDTPENAVLLRVSAKIREACACALANGFEYIWIDSCCIDKTSSSELSESINSMYLWYRLSTICYAYLRDVHDFNEDPNDENSQFRRSVWFLRGWTLQELIAPKDVRFFSSDWREIGTKHELADVVGAVTRIDKGILTGADTLESVSVARRMSWASTRVTTREEDEAYSLMGIFGINMSTLYGEGRKAFFRLQQEILLYSSDQSIFVWDWNDDTSRSSDLNGDNRHTLLASSPAAFLHSSNVRPITRQRFFSSFWCPTGAEHQGGDPWFPPSTYETTPYGVHTKFPIIGILPKPLALLKSPPSSEVYGGIKVVPLACEEENEMLALILKNAPNQVDSRLDVRTIGTTESRVRHCEEHQYHPHIVIWPPSAPSDAPNRRLIRVVRIVSPWMDTLYRLSAMYLVQNPLLLTLSDDGDADGPSADDASPDYQLTLPLSHYTSSMANFGYTTALFQVGRGHAGVPQGGSSPPAYTLKVTNGIHTLTFTFPRKQDSSYCLIPMPTVSASYDDYLESEGSWEVSQDGTRLSKTFRLPRALSKAGSKDYYQMVLDLVLDCESPGFSGRPASFVLSVNVRRKGDRLDWSDRHPHIATLFGVVLTLAFIIGFIYGIVRLAKLVGTYSSFKLT